MEKSTGCRMTMAPGLCHMLLRIAYSGQDLKDGVLESGEQGRESREIKGENSVLTGIGEMERRVLP
ncbi:MAG: hypothetical protein ACYDBP_05760 [Leptospirales bacterium]